METLNRMNTVWQSLDGTWNRGFHPFEVVGPDEEWDVEYDLSSFSTVARGYATAQEALDSWTGADPGAWGYADLTQSVATCQYFDAMARALEQA